MSFEKRHVAHTSINNTSIILENSLMFLAHQSPLLSEVMIILIPISMD
jgi:hypothetical protein